MFVFIFNQWEVFSIPELQNFMKILDREEEEHILQVSSSMFSKSVFICLASLLLMFHAKKKSTCHKSSQFLSISGFLCKANLNL